MKYVMHLFEPRWHGWARWSLEEWEEFDTIAVGDVVATGWMRPGRGAAYMRMEETEQSRLARTARRAA